MPTPLSPLLGTAPPDTWRITTSDRVTGDGRLAIFAIVERVPSPQSVKLLGTGFYLQPQGGIATAGHVAEEAQRLLSASPDSVGIAHTLPTGRTRFLPIWKFYLHPTADVAFGVPRYEFVDDASGQALRAKVLSLTGSPPDVGAEIGRWSYPRHAIVDDAELGRVLYLQPTFYNGCLQEIFRERGPSAKLVPPYYQTNIHLHGGSSGGPVFYEGHVFGVASSSFDGAEDIAFVTPASALLEIRIPKVVGGENDTETERLGDIAARGSIATG